MRNALSTSLAVPLTALTLVLLAGCTNAAEDAAPDPAAEAVARAPAETVEAHVAAATAAAGEEHTGLLDRICTQATAPAPAPRQGGGAGGGAGAGARREGPPPRSEWYVEPAKVFDNLFYVGMREYTAWAVTTSEGIIIIDPLYDYAVEDAVVNNLTKLGLDPNTIEYVLVSHAHSDHVGGARYLQERFGARVVLAEGDWDLLARNTAPWPKPTRDIVAGDGYELKLGDTTLKLYVTPGHTPGTISSLIPVRDGERSHVAAIWGGTAFNFLNNPDEDHAFWYRSYIDSAQRFRGIATAAGADVLISNHANFDGSETKLPALAQRAAGDAHPYVVGGESVRRYLTVAAECAQAGLLTLG